MSLAGAPLGSHRGIALLITLSVITVLITVAVELNRRVREGIIATAAARDRMTLSMMAEAGIHAAMTMLSKDKTESSTDSIQEDWANSAKIAEVLASIQFEKGRVTFAIQDEMGKIQVNALVDFPKGRHFNENQKIMWDRFLRLILSRDEERFEGIEAPTILNSVKDWLDSGDDDATTGLTGAEAEYYRGLNPPYEPANGPFRDIEELMLVKDVSPEFFNGIPGVPGIENYLTVYGMTQSPKTVEKRDYTFEGKININTADLPVLVALMPSENTDYAQAIFDYRIEMDDGNYVNDLTSPTWYKNVADIPGDFVIDPKLISVSSDFFRIVSTAELGSAKRTITAVIHREQAKKTGKWSCRVLNWQVN